MPKPTQQARRITSQKTGAGGRPVGAISISTTATLARTNLTEFDRKEIKPKEGQITTIAEFLGLSDFETKTIDLRIGLTNAIIRLQADAKMTQAALAKKLGMSRPRIAEIEAHKPTTSFDTLIPA